MNNYYTAELIRNLRIKNNLTIQDVAQHLGVSKVAVSKWENCDNINIENLYELALLYNVTVEELLKGQLNAETGVDYVLKEYDILEYSFTDINEKNMDNIVKFYECYSTIRKRFFFLTLKYINNDINDLELKEYHKLLENFKVDDEYLNWLVSIGKITNDDRMLFSIKNVPSILENFNHLTKEELMWEITKFYNFKHDIKIEEILYSGNYSAIAYMFMNLSQQEKDYIFNQYSCYEYENGIKMYDLRIRDYNVNKIMVKNKANCFSDILFSLNQFEFEHPTELDEDLFKSIIGNLETKIDYVEAHKVLESKYLYFEDITFWKHFTLEEYNKIIDNEKTRKFKNELFVREKNPMKYFKENYLFSKE